MLNVVEPPEGLLADFYRALGVLFVRLVSATFWGIERPHVTRVHRGPVSKKRCPALPGS